MAVKFSNNAVTTLSAGINAGVTSFQVASSSGFPTLGGSDHTYVTVDNEVVKITAISGTTFTCVATSSSHSNGDNVELRMTAELLDDFATDTEALPIAGGTMTGNTVHNDGVKSIYGTSSDGLEIHHTSGNSFIQDSGTGQLFIKASGIDFQNPGGTATLAQMVVGGAVNLHHNGSKKIETTSAGVTAQGRLEIQTPNDANTHLVQRMGSDNSTYGYADFELVTPNSTATNLPRLDMQIGNANILSLCRGGNVGIGTTSPDALIETAFSSSTAYSTSGQPTESILISNINGSDGSGVNNYATLGFGVAAGATSQGFINYVRTADNAGAFTISQRIASSTYKEHLRITSAGNVGIGTSSPAPAYGSDTVLEVSGSASPGLVINDTGQGSKYGIHADSTKIKITYGSNTLLSIDGSATSALTINSSGNVGIGDPTPESRLKVYSNALTSLKLEMDGVGAPVAQFYARSGSFNNTILQLYSDRTSSSAYNFLNVKGDVDGTEFTAFQIRGDGKVLIGGTTNAYSAPMLLTVSDIGLDVTDGTKHLVSWASHGGSSHAGSALGTRSNHDLALITNDVKRIIVTNSGKVGINVVAPTEPLQVHGAIRSTNNASTTLADSGNFYYIPTADDGSNPRTVISGVGTSSVGAHVTFKTGTSSSNTEKVRITSAGNVGIGTAIPNEGGFQSGSRVLSIQGASADDFGVIELISPNVTSSNRIGELRFGNLDGGSSFVSNAGIRVTRDGADNSSAMGLWTTGTGSFNERIRISSTGNVGIGETDVSAAKLSINNVLSGDVGIKITQDQAEIALKIDQNGNNRAIYIDAESTTNNSFEVRSDVLTTGSGALFYSDSSDTGTRSVVEIHNDNGGSSGTNALKVVQDAAGNGIYLDQVGNKYGFYLKHSGNTYAGMKIVADSLTTKQAAHFYSNSSSSDVRNLVDIQNDHTNANGTTLLRIVNDATGPLADVNGTGGWIENGMITRIFSFDMALNVTTNFDIPMTNTVNVFEITAIHGYYPGVDYYASIVGFYAYRSDTGVVRIENFNDHSSSNSGSWTVSNPNTTTLRITKVAGAASAGAKGFVEVKYRNA